MSRKNSDSSDGSDSSDDENLNLNIEDKSDNEEIEKINLIFNLIINLIIMINQIKTILENLKE